MLPCISQTRPWCAALLSLCMIHALAIHGGDRTIARAQSPTSATDQLSAIMVLLETDCLKASNELLALCDQAASQNRSLDSSLVHALVLSARTVGRQGHWNESIELLDRAHLAVKASPPSASSAALLPTVELAIASAATQVGQWNLVAKHCQAVIENSAAPTSHRAAAFPILVKAHQSAAQLNEAVAILQLATTEKTVQSVYPQLAELAVNVGSAFLQQKNANAANDAYAISLKLSPDGPMAVDAELGQAWAAALGCESPEVASEKLAGFAQRHPQHPDAPHSLRAAASCLDQMDQAENAESLRAKLLSMYPTSEAAESVLDHYTRAGTPWSQSVREVWATRLDATGAPSHETAGTASAGVEVTAQQLVAVFIEALQANDDLLWQAAVNWLISGDSNGKKTDVVLAQLIANQSDSIAEHLAVDLIARAESSTQDRSPAASESACRWAGANERWTMLALAADELGPPSNASFRSLAIDRILAESLMQTQRPAEAMTWWDCLIDQRKATDFATLLRGAETAVAHGEIDVAAERIKVARLAAGDVAFNRELTQILSAELAIRRARFDEAREILSEIVRAPDPSPTLRPRAQWLVGETFFLQQRYADAIDAYRRVDSLDEAGQWAPAALLQAGKAFEKLGRSREAATCYTALLNRFQQWPHSSVAQSRLAALNPQKPSDEPGSVLR